MAGSKRVGLLAVGAILWAGLCLLGPQTPLAGERQAAKPGDREAKALPPTGSVDFRCETNQPTTILSVVPPGKSVKRGDLLVELDVSSLADKKSQQFLHTRKAETDWILAKESQHWEQQAATGQADLAAKALRLAQGQLKAFMDGEYPHQLALAEGADVIAKEKRMMAEERVSQLRASFETQKDQAVRTALLEAQLALQEASMQSRAVEGSLSILKSFVHDNRVAELELAVAQREFDLARAKDALSAATARGGAICQLAEGSYQMESDRLARLDDQIRKSKIYAPQDGTVVYPDDAGEAAVRPDAVARPRQVLVRLLPVIQPK